VSLNPHDVRGRRVRTWVDEFLLPTQYRLPWDVLDAGGARVASGLSLYRLTSM
jgi:hypothetical protein